jgi:hypothetical protein
MIAQKVMVSDLMTDRDGKRAFARRDRAPGEAAENSHPQWKCYLDVDARGF